MPGPVAITYDRTALMALPDEMCNRYSAHLFEITNHSQQLLVCFKYDQTLMRGPPHSINADEMHRIYQRHYGLNLLNLLNRTAISDGLKG